VGPSVDGDDDDNNDDDDHDDHDVERGPEVMGASQLGSYKSLFPSVQ
jgi:hypothetical protein